VEIADLVLKDILKKKEGTYSELCKALMLKEFSQQDMELDVGWVVPFAQEKYMSVNHAPSEKMILCR
jgi:hypothetical protein